MGLDDNANNLDQQVAGAQQGVAIQVAAAQQMAFAHQVGAAHQAAAALGAVQAGAAQNVHVDENLVALIPGAKGVPKACFGGHIFVRHKRLADGETWRYICEYCNVPKNAGDTPKCYACIHVLPVPHNEAVGRCVYISPREHNHEANAAKQHHLLVSKLHTILHRILPTILPTILPKTLHTTLHTFFLKYRFVVN